MYILGVQVGKVRRGIRRGEEEEYVMEEKGYHHHQTRIPKRRKAMTQTE